MGFCEDHPQAQSPHRIHNQLFTVPLLICVRSFSSLSFSACWSRYHVRRLPIQCPWCSRLITITVAPLVATAPLPRAAIQPRCPNMLCRIATVSSARSSITDALTDTFGQTPSDSSLTGSSTTEQIPSGQSTMEDLIDGLLLVLSSMRELARAAAAPSPQASVDATPLPTSGASTLTTAVDLASLATFTPESPAPTAS